MNIWQGLRNIVPQSIKDWKHQQVVNAYARWYYSARKRTWENMTWQGTRICKTPADLWIYQEIIHEVRPELIVETGTLWGGSALYYAHLLDLCGDGHVVTIDITDRDRPAHDRLEYITASSIDPDVVERVHKLASDMRTLVILDSDHRRDHVLAELTAYADIVTPGSYLIVEDTHVGRVERDHAPGPMEALDAFLPDPRFEVDRSREKFGHTFNPSGYLRRHGVPQ